MTSNWIAKRGGGIKVCDETGSPNEGSASPNEGWVYYMWSTCIVTGGVGFKKCDQPASPKSTWHPTKQAMQMSCPSRDHAYHDPVNHVSNPCCQAAPVRTLKTANSKKATFPSRKELLWRTTSVPISELLSHDSREPLKDAMLQRANGQWPVWLLVFLALLGLCY